MPPSDMALQGMSPWPSTSLFARDIEQITGVHDWNSCMAINYCKWPVIVGIIVVSLILISILWCCLSCCGCCVNCLTCCCPCGKHTKYQQAPQYQQPYPPQQPYQRGQMAYGGVMPTFQFATFDASSKKGQGGTLDEDALPSMPSWQDAKSRHVEDPDSDHESKPLQSPAKSSSQDIALEKLASPSTNKPSLASPIQHEDTRYYGAGAAVAGVADRYKSTESQAQQPVDTSSSYLDVHPAHRQYQNIPNDNYEHDLGNPYAYDNLRTSATSPAASSIYSNHPPPSYHTSATSQRGQGQPDSYGNYGAGGYNTGLYGGGYGGNNTKYQELPAVNPSDLGRYGSTTSTRYAPSTNYASTVGYEPSTIYEAPAEAEGNSPYHNNTSYYTPAPAPAALMPGGGRLNNNFSHRSNASIERKPIKGSWKEV